MPISKKPMRQKKVETWIGSVKKGMDVVIMGAIAGETNLVDLDVLSHQGDQTYIRITAHSEATAVVESALSLHGFEPFDVGVFSEHYGQNVDEIIAAYQTEVDRLESQIRDTQSRARDLAKHVDDFRVLYDFELWKKQKDALQSDIYVSDRAFAF